MSVKVAHLCIGGLVLLAGCQTVASGNDLPARIVEPTDASRLALQTVVNKALGTDVMLAGDALISTNILTIERRPPGNMQGPLATGRNLDAPIQFQLVSSDGSCILIDTRDRSRHVLSNTRCVAL